MRLSFFPNQSARNAAPIWQAFQQGMSMHGITLQENCMHSDAVVLWSRLWAGRMRANRDVYQHYKSLGKPVVFIDVGSLRRNHTWKISLFADSMLCARNQNPSRARAMGLVLDPWRSAGEHILIAMQRPDSEQWTGQPACEVWLHETVQRLASLSDRPIMVRPHPRFRLDYNSPRIEISMPQRVAGTYDDFDFDLCLRNAWCVVNWNSSPGVVASLKGVPAFVDHTSLAAPVADQDLSRIESPSMPDRQQWLNDLAWTEWTQEEIALGLPQEMLLLRLQDYVNNFRNR
jgi:hypothetical protein